MKSRQLFLCLAGFVTAGACSGKATPLEVTGVPAQSFSVSVGGEIDIQMGTIGPGEYVSPPGLTGSTLQFLDVTSPSVALPSGVQQIFRFRGLTAGPTVIVFHNTSPSGLVHPDVIDTVNVR